MQRLQTGGSSLPTRRPAISPDAQPQPARSRRGGYRSFAHACAEELLRHADGWMTAYGHADEILVTRGDQVKRGQVVARVGATGNVTSPQVHFEIRRGSRAVNPRDHLISETASSD